MLQKLWQVAQWVESGGWRFTAHYNRNQERRRSKNCASIVTWRRVAGWIGRILGCLWWDRCSRFWYPFSLCFLSQLFEIFSVNSWWTHRASAYASTFTATAIPTGISHQPAPTTSGRGQSSPWGRKKSLHWSTELILRERSCHPGHGTSFTFCCFKHLMDTIHPFFLLVLLSVSRLSRVCSF